MSERAIAEELARQPLGTNPFDFGLRPLIESKDAAVLNLPRASEILGLARDIAGASTLPGLAFELYRLEVERRPPTANMAEIMAALKATLAQIEAQVGDDLYNLGNLIGDSWYNCGIACRMTCAYLEAASCQQHAHFYYSVVGRFDKAWSSYFLIHVELFSAVCVNSDDRDRISSSFNQLITVRRAIDSELLGEQMPGWLKKNRQPHCLLAAIWNDDWYQSMGSDTKFCREELMAHLRALAEVVDEEDASLIVGKAVAMADQYWDFPTSSTGNAVLTALLIGARQAYALGEDGKARQLYERILTWTGNDGAVPMAVARRELAAL